MGEDIVPDLLEMIEKEFGQQTLKSEKIKKALQLLQEGKATYLDANDFAIEVGEILASVFGKNITAEMLPDGKMYFNIAERILNPTLQNNYDLISGYTTDVQKQLNQQANIGLKTQVPELNQDRIDGLVNRITSEENFDAIKWILDDPVVNFCQSIVDDYIKANAEFQAKAGFSSKLRRRVSGHACDWCKSLAGIYDYYDAPDDIYRRHQRCRCTVEYNPKDGRGIQDSHSKVWTDPDKEQRRLELREQFIESEEIKEARKLIRIAKNHEKMVTKDLLSISKNVGSEMAGLEYRLKTSESLARKLTKEPNAKMRDILRYTNISNVENQVDVYRKTIEQLIEKGYNISAVKNYWNDHNNPYNGININLLTPSKYEFELQFHTQESFDLKNDKLHKLYEKQRVLDPIKDNDEISKLDVEMDELSSKLFRPKNIESIGGSD